MRAMGGDVSGPSFTEGLSILIIQEAVEILFSPKDMEVIRLDLEQRFQTEGCARAAAVEAASKAEDHASDLMSQLAPDAFTCPGEAGEGCVLPRSFVNDRKCDCPGTCADEELFTCETCVPKTPFAAAVSSDEDKEVGMALGLGLGTALGLALGLGLGLTVAAGAFLAVGLLEMLVPDPQEKGIWV
eukprot:g7378.t1